MSFGTQNLKLKIAHELEVCLSPLLLKTGSTGAGQFGGLLWGQVLTFPSSSFKADSLDLETT